MLKRLTQTGDTIVEVMVVLAVLGLAISISYATANRSLLNARQAQENSDAAGYVQAQVENLRVLAPTSTSGNPNNIFGQTHRFCTQLVSNSVTIVPFSAANCTFPAGGLYVIAVYNCDDGGIRAAYPNQCSGVATNSNTLVVQASWGDVLGQGTDTVTLTYRDHAQ